MRLIEPGVLAKMVKLAKDSKVSYLALMGYLARVRPVNAEPIRHERWMRIEGREERRWHQCSGCGRDVLVPVQKDYDVKDALVYRYCPYCGGKMDWNELQSRIENGDPAFTGYRLEGNLLVEDESWDAE